MKYTLVTSEVTLFGKAAFERDRVQLPWLWLAKLLSRCGHFDNGRSWSECYVLRDGVPVWFSNRSRSCSWSECYLGKAAT